MSLLAKALGFPTRAAEIRWREFNRRQLEQGCPCGQPAQTLVESTHGQVGNVKPAFARCAKHADVPLTVPWDDVECHMRPLLGADRDHCRWRSGRIAGPVEDCECGTHVGEDQS